MAVYLVKGKSSMKTDIARKALRSFKGTVYEEEDLEKIVSGSDIIVDCLLGTGVHGELRDPYARVIKIRFTVK